MYVLRGKDEPQVDILRGAHLINDPVIKQIQDMFNIGEEGTLRVFEGAVWAFSADQEFIFIPPQTAHLRDDLYPIRGSYSLFDGIIEFRSESISPLGASASLDGFIHADGPSFLLDAIYCVSSSMMRPLVVRISQSLCEEPTPGFDHELIGPSVSAKPRDNAVASGADSSESPIIPVPAIYNVTITGSTEAQAFGPLPGKLFIMPPDPADTNPFSVTLAAEGDCTCGWIAWFSLDFNGLDQTGRQNSRIQVSGNQALMELIPSEQMQSTTWFTLATDHFDHHNVGVRAKAATFIFTVDQDQISGEIYGSGTYDSPPLSNRPSTYQAQIKGRLEASILVREARMLIENIGLNGRWQSEDHSLGLIELASESEKLAGTFTGQGGGTMSGNLSGSRFDFTWVNKERRKGWGFARVIAMGELLAGLWGDDGDKGNSCALAASLELPELFASERFTIEDRRSLRHLGTELLLSGKTEMAAKALEQALALYRQGREEGENVYLDTEGNLIDEATILNYLAACYFQLGDYDRMLKRLEDAVEIRHLLSADQNLMSKSAFRISELTKAIDQALVLVKYLQSNLSEVKAKIKSGYIGIGLNRDQKTGKLVINNVAENSPAFAAGVSIGDEVIEIDGQDTTGGDSGEISAWLSGDVGASLSLTVCRRQERLSLKINRARFPTLSPQREAAVTEAVASLSKILDAVVRRLIDDSRLLGRLKDRIAAKRLSPVRGLESIAAYLKNEHAYLNNIVREVLSRTGAIFKDESELLHHLGSLSEAFILEDSASVSALRPESISETEKAIHDALEINTRMAPVEKSLFFECLKINCLSILAYQFVCEHDLIKKLNVRQMYESQVESDRSYASTLADYLDRWRERLITDLDKIEALSEGQSFLQRLIRFLVEMGKEEDALIVSERARARAFTDMMAARLDAYNSGKGETVFKDRVISLEVAPPPTTEQIRQIAKDHQATLVEYTMIDRVESELLIWVVKPEGRIYLRSIDTSAIFRGQLDSVETLVEAARDNLGVRWRDARPANKAALMTDSSLLEKLHQLLIQPIADLLPGDSEANVIFIPQGPLFLIPFPALQESPGKYLIDKHTMLTAPSIQALGFTAKICQQLASEHNNNALVVGNPTMPKLSVAAEQPPSQLLPLPGAEEEAKEVASLLKTREVTGGRATKSFVMRRMLEARIIHLATHGLLDDLSGIGMPGAIALAPSEDDDGFLTSREIINMDLRAELVILSACNTGRGKITGDGVVGLSRSFILAGVPSVIVSLWAVWDASTAWLMKEFYKNYLEGVDKAQALRQAMLTVKSVSKEPIYWAGFTLNGEAKSRAYDAGKEELGQLSIL